MASRSIATEKNGDMSGISSSATGSASGAIVAITFNDTGGTKMERAASLHRLTEKLAEEGWI